MNFPLALVAGLVLTVSVPVAQAQEPAPANVPPAAHAGADQVVTAGSVVTLDASQSQDPDGGQIAYSWRQIDGPAVQLSPPRSPTPSFTSLGAGAVYLFALTVSDGAGGVGTDTVVVAAEDPLAAHLSSQAFAPTGSPAAYGVRLVERSVKFLNVFLFLLSLLSSLFTVLDRLPHFMASREAAVSVRQFIGRRFRRWSWLVLIGGALLNSVLLWWFTEWHYFAAGFAYALFLGVKVVFEVRFRPSHGVVLDAITRVPVDLAVVRLYEEKTGRLVVTRATDDHGTFFVLPAAGSYRVEVTKQGYAPFVKERLVVGASDSAVYLKAMLMPSLPHGAAPVPALSGNQQ
jgi:hypothetical protein